MNTNQSDQDINKKHLVSKNQHEHYQTDGDIAEYHVCNSNKDAPIKPVYPSNYASASTDAAVNLTGKIMLLS